ncbi:MAG TPA: hypothetical protein PLW44_15735 [Chitinophagales bacterium]|nr:hypothetical protein [Chitinophagales bacterium]
MKQNVLDPAFSDAELAVLQLFKTRNISETDSIEIRAILAKHFLDKARAAADKAWDAKGHTKETVDKLLDSDK